MGTVGEPPKLELTAVGDSVNVTARLASVAGADEVLVTLAAARAAGLEEAGLTAESYASTVRLYIVPAIGKIQLAKLQADDINRMTGRLAARRDLEHVADDRLAPLYRAAIGLGLRQGELLGLRWSDVNLEAGTLTVRHSRNARTGALAEPKTDRSRRTLRLGGDLMATLRAHRVAQVAERLAAGRRWQDGDYVFATATGQSLDAANLSRRFHASIAAAGLPDQRFHDLRHACATLRLEQGEELAIVSRILGHASITTTANVYGHMTDAMARRAAERTDAILGGRMAVRG